MYASKQAKPYLYKHISFLVEAQCVSQSVSYHGSCSHKNYVDSVQDKTLSSKHNAYLGRYCFKASQMETVSNHLTQ